MRPPWAWKRIPLALPETPPGVGGADPPCVVHLVREANGLDHLRGFAEAFRAHPPGVACELVLAMKGFTSLAQAKPYLEEVADLAPETLFCADGGADLGTYLVAATRLRRDRYCFVNSFSRPLVDGWLQRLDAALARPGVGQVGATGAWASGHSWTTYSMGLPSAYRGLLPPAPTARALTRGLELKRKGRRRRSVEEAVRARLKTLRGLPGTLFYYEPFPAHKLRSNAFMIAHETLRELALFVVRNKQDAYSLEGSRECLTRRLEQIGLSSLVVDRAGEVYRSGEWDRSRTLWQGDQEGLLVADNQTLHYTHGDFELRHLLSTLAWGIRADPEPPRDAPASSSPGTRRSDRNSSPDLGAANRASGVDLRLGRGRKQFRRGESRMVTAKVIDQCSTASPRASSPTGPTSTASSRWPPIRGSRGSPPTPR